jgi:uncharacterized protein
MQDTLRKALEAIIEVAAPDKIILFGSRAKGNARIDSDYDLLVLKKGLVRSRELCQKIYLNFRNIGAPVDILVCDYDKFETEKNLPYKIYNTINIEGKIVYEKS